MMNDAIKQLVDYALANELIHPDDEIYARNQILMVLELDEYEAEEGFTPEFVDPRHAIETNLHHDHSGKESAMFPREAGVLKWLLDEGFF